MRRGLVCITLLYVSSGMAIRGAEAQRSLSFALELRGAATHPIPCFHTMCYESDGAAPSREAVAEVRPLSGVSIYGAYSDYRVVSEGPGHGVAAGLRFG